MVLCVVGGRSVLGSELPGIVARNPSPDIFVICCGCKYLQECFSNIFAKSLSVVFPTRVFLHLCYFQFNLFAWHCIFILRIGYSSQRYIVERYFEGCSSQSPLLNFTLRWPDCWNYPLSFNTIGYIDDLVLEEITTVTAVALQIFQIGFFSFRVPCG